VLKAQGVVDYCSAVEGQYVTEDRLEREWEAMHSVGGVANGSRRGEVRHDVQKVT
jgi:hypothetical protein